MAEPTTKKAPPKAKLSITVEVNSLEALDKVVKALRGCGVEVTPTFGGGDGP